MPILIGPRRRFKFKVSEYEFILTKLLLDNLYVDFEPDYELSFNCNPLSYNGSLLHFAERYLSLMNIPNDETIFRPLKSDKHANVLIDMFEQLELIETDGLTIMEYEENGNKLYKGYFTNNCKKIDKSYTYNAQSIPILKSFMVAKLLLDSDDYNIFINNLMQFNRQLYRTKNNSGVSNNV